MIVFYIILSVGLMSFIEWVGHYYIMHRKFPFCDKIFRNHAILHHRTYFKVFNHEEDEAGRQLNIKLEVFEDLLRASPLLILLYLVSPLFCVIFTATFVAHHVIWNLIHSEMHNPTDCFFRDFGVFKWLQSHHWMHHRYPGRNYNVVLPLFDYIFGTHQPMSDKDRGDRFEELGY